MGSNQGHHLAGLRMDLGRHSLLQTAGYLRINGSNGLKANPNFQSKERLLGRHLGLCKASLLKVILAVMVSFLALAVRLMHTEKVRWAVNTGLELA